VSVGKSVGDLDAITIGNWPSAPPVTGIPLTRLMAKKNRLFRLEIWTHHSRVVPIHQSVPRFSDEFSDYEGVKKTLFAESCLICRKIVPAVGIEMFGRAEKT
jgi:hypothetical protein